jgi:hypothetical protein
MIGSKTGETWLDAQFDDPESKQRRSESIQISF